MYSSCADSHFEQFQAVVRDKFLENINSFVVCYIDGSDQHHYDYYDVNNITSDDIRKIIFKNTEILSAKYVFTAYPTIIYFKTDEFFIDKINNGKMLFNKPYGIEKDCIVIILNDIVNSTRHIWSTEIENPEWYWTEFNDIL